jgi:uncharacterized membrane protein YgcG
MRVVHALPALLLLAANTVVADERILAYESDIEVHVDATMTVTETIRVRAEGNQIKRGIYRDFPTLYKDRLGNRYRVGFEIMAVTRDGEIEPYHMESRSNGVRIYMGDKNVFLRRGEYTYAITYRTNRQLGFFADHDELYWNVTGNDWAFPIDNASARVHLPTSIPLASIRLEAYTGRFGAKGTDYGAKVDIDGNAYFEVTRPLARQEGLTIVVMWPKGHIAEPALADELSYLFNDNRHLAVIAAGIALLLAYYLLVWVKVGKDPEAGVIMPQYTAPKEFSPASMRFVRRMGYDHKTFAAAIVNLAAKGFLTIEEDDSTYSLEKTGKNSVQMAPGEQALVSKLFGGRDAIELVSANHGSIRRALEAHKNSLKRNYEKIYFLSNSAYLLPGVLISIGALIAGALALPSGSEGFAAVFLTVWLSVWTIAVVGLVIAAVRSWRNVSAGGVGKALTATLFAIPFVFFEGMGLWMFAEATAISIGVALVLLVLVNMLFYHLLKAPTRVGRKLLDKIEGFRHYLQVAEGQQLKARLLPRKTLDLFEIYLPYALALDVEQHWTEQFAQVFADIRKEQGRRYHPSWYRSSHGYSRMSDMTASLGNSLGSAISSSSRAPGSSSGGGGGGSSGGGGGGGGGGGW